MNLNDSFDMSRIKDEIADSFDEELEMELDESRLEEIFGDLSDHPEREQLARRTYFRELFRLQYELVGRMLVRSGIVLIKYWFSITDEEQRFRFDMRIHDPLKQWKLSPMDVESRRRWEDYTRAKEDMLARTHIPEAPWWVVEAVDKKRARLNCIAHLLEQIPYEDVPKQAVVLPDRERHDDYIRHPVPDEIKVPSRF